MKLAAVVGHWMPIYFIIVGLCWRLVCCQSAASPASLAPELQSLESVFPIPPYLLAGQTVDDIVVQWNQAAQYNVAQAGNSYVAARLYTLMHLAMLEAWKVNNVTGVGADPGAVVGYAAMMTLKAFKPSGFAGYNQLYLQQTANLTETQIQFAESIAGPPVSRFLGSRINDGFEKAYFSPPTTAPYGDFVNTSAVNDFPYDPYGFVPPLILPTNLSSLDFYANFSAPPVLNSSDYNIQLTAVSVYGDANSTVRTLGQTNTAYFWADEANTASVVGLWNRVLTSTLPTSIGLDESVMLFAGFNAGLYDCIVATWNLKQQFNRWRPVTAIRAGSNQNPPDPSWTSLLGSPDSPTYPSISGCWAGLASTLLQDYYGTDDIFFTVASEAPDADGNYLPPRTFQSFSQVATEVIESRYYSGSEFPVDSTSGQELGINIAAYAIEKGILDNSASQNLYFG